MAEESACELCSAALAVARGSLPAPHRRVHVATSCPIPMQYQDDRLITDALEYMKEEYAARMAAAEAKEAKLKEDRANIEAMVERFRDFIADNDAKRARADLKATAEREAREALEGEERELRGTLTDLQVHKKQLEDGLTKLEPYATFMDKVVAANSDEYTEPANVLARHSTLVSTQASLRGVNRAASAAVEQTRTSLAELQSSGTNRGLSLTSQVQALQKQLEELSMANSERREAATRKQDDEHTAIQEAREVATSIRNMYGRCWRGSRSTTRLAMPARPAAAGPGAAPAPDKAGQLDTCLEFVQRRLQDLQQLQADFPAWQVAQEAALAAAGLTSSHARGKTAADALAERHKRIRAESKRRAATKAADPAIPAALAAARSTEEVPESQRMRSSARSVGMSSSGTLTTRRDAGLYANPHIAQLSTATTLRRGSAKGSGPALSRTSLATAGSRSVLARSTGRLNSARSGLGSPTPGAATPNTQRHNSLTSVPSGTLPPGVARASGAGVFTVSLAGAGANVLSS